MSDAMHRREHNGLAWHDDPDEDHGRPDEADRRQSVHDEGQVHDDGLRVVHTPHPAPDGRWEAAPREAGRWDEPAERTRSVDEDEWWRRPDAADQPRRPDPTDHPRRPDAADQPRRPDPTDHPRHPDLADHPGRPERDRSGGPGHDLHHDVEQDRPRGADRYRDDRGSLDQRLAQLPPPVVRDDRRPPAPRDDAPPHGWDRPPDVVPPGVARAGEGDHDRPDRGPRGHDDIARSDGVPHGDDADHDRVGRDPAQRDDIGTDRDVRSDDEVGASHEIEEAVPASAQLRASLERASARVRRSVPLRTALFVLPPLLLPPALGLPLGTALTVSLLLLWLAVASALLATVMFDGSDQLALRAIDRRLQALEATAGHAGAAAAGPAPASVPVEVPAARAAGDTEDALLAIGSQLDRLNDRLDELAAPGPQTPRDPSDRPTPALDRPDVHRPAEQWSGQPHLGDDGGDAPDRGRRQWSDEGWQGRMR